MKKFFWLIYLALFGIFLFILFNWVMESIIHKRKETRVPAIVGKSIFEALSLLSQRNLGVIKIKEEYREKIPHGTILKQIPSPGTVVREGKIIKVVISLGGEYVFVPNLINKTLRQAEILLKQSELNISKVERKYSLKYERNRIISQSPPPDEVVLKESEVNLVVSKGPPSSEILIIPDFKGTDVKEAISWALNNKLKFSIIERSTENFTSGYVFHQEPEPDSVIEPWMSVQFFAAPPLKLLSSKGLKWFSYNLPAGGHRMKVKFILFEMGKGKEIFSSIRLQNCRIWLPIIGSGQRKIRVFINDVLVEERALL